MSLVPVGGWPTLCFPAAPRRFTCCVRACRPALTLVSQRWQRVFYAEPGLWSHLRLEPRILHNASQERWRANTLRLVQRVAGVVTAASFSCPPNEGFTMMLWSMAVFKGLVTDVLSLLQPNTLTQLACSEFLSPNQLRSHNWENEQRSCSQRQSWRCCHASQALSSCS